MFKYLVKPWEKKKKLQGFQTEKQIQCPLAKLIYIYIYIYIYIRVISTTIQFVEGKEKKTTLNINLFAAAAASSPYLRSNNYQREFNIWWWDRPPSSTGKKLLHEFVSLLMILLNQIPGNFLLWIRGIENSCDMTVPKSLAMEPSTQYLRGFVVMGASYMSS